MTVQHVFAEVFVASVHDALARSQGIGGDKDVVNDNKLSRVTKDIATPTLSSSAVVPLPYPLGRCTLQVTGMHVSLQETEKSDGQRTATGDFVVLLRAHVKGMLDTDARVFTVAAMKFSGNNGTEGASLDKRGAIEDCRYAAGKTAVLPAPKTLSGKLHQLPRTGFAQLDLRLQMEGVSFSVQVLPAGPRRSTSPTPVNSFSSFRKGGSGGGGSLRVRVVGVLSPLLPS
ncbi:hypothetical protein MOQ_008277 [Trypanosoma cruzi marinkellei]|uniref:Uncharacterized protein n=1 Tax=Trypanosoma cruzi marinkellei TaxID=85056 RepID=K2N055_TRYCR|nr:hypothetical protein MOQ_008277 [Trypanosoma cruzi marinkellei]